MTRHKFDPTSPYKWCPTCESYKLKNEFYVHRSNFSGLTSSCKSCTKSFRSSPRGRLIVKHWISKNKEHVNQKRREYYHNLRDTFLRMYGEKCDCCGESEPVFLAIDHVNGQKGTRRRESPNEAYAKAIKKFNPKEYRILCHNCNQAVIYGECPHQRNKYER